MSKSTGIPGRKSRVCQFRADSEHNLTDPKKDGGAIREKMSCVLHASHMAARASPTSFRVIKD
jgi:hypothetical protein